jgi:ribosomal protein S26
VNWENQFALQLKELANNLKHAKITPLYIFAKILFVLMFKVSTAVMIKIVILRFVILCFLQY